FQPQPERSHVLAPHPLYEHVPEERIDVPPNALSRQLLALLVPPDSYARLQPALRCGTHAAPHVRGHREPGTQGAGVVARLREIGAERDPPLATVSEEPHVPARPT